MMDFWFRWRHIDGSIVTFSPDGWASSDPEKTAWLNSMNHLTSSPHPLRLALENDSKMSANYSKRGVLTCLESRQPAKAYRYSASARVHTCLQTAAPTTDSRAAPVRSHPRFTGWVNRLYRLRSCRSTVDRRQAILFQCFPVR